MIVLNKKTGLLAVVMGCAQLVCAQQVQQDSALLPLSADFRMRYDFYAKDLVGQPSLGGIRYGRVEGGYYEEKGPYRTAQAPQSQRDIFFNTEGARQIKKFLTSGSFSYTRSLQDSVAYTLRNDPTDPAPYYYYSARPGNWQQIRYRLQGMVSHPLLHDKINIGAGITYNSSDGWRSNDPRSEYFVWDMLAGLALRYRFLPKQELGIAANIIKKNSDLTWGYRNDNNSTVAEFRTYLQDGYGYVEPLADLKSGTISSATHGYELQGMYDAHFSFGTLSLKGKYRNTTSEYFRKPVDKNEIRLDYGQFYDDIYSAELLWQYRRARHSLGLQASYTNELGKDYNKILAGNNYIYADEQLGIRAGWSKYNAGGQVNYELGATVRLADQVKLDGTVGQRMEYQYSYTALSGAYYCYFPGNKSLLKTSLQASLQQPLHTEVASPVQTFNFTAGVPLRDYYYYNAPVAGADLGLLYQLPVEKTNIFIQLQGHYTRADVEGPNPLVLAASYPGNNRWAWQMSIGVTL